MAMVALAFASGIGSRGGALLHPEVEERRRETSKPAFLWHRARRPASALEQIESTTCQSLAAKIVRKRERAAVRDWPRIRFRFGPFLGHGSALVSPAATGEIVATSGGFDWLQPSRPTRPAARTNRSLLSRLMLLRGLDDELHGRAFFGITAGSVSSFKNFSSFMVSEV